MKILIVDDNATNRKLLKVQLEAEGHIALEAEDGGKALDLLRQEMVDAIISDILMPRVDGYKLCYEIRKDPKLQTIPLIMYSASYTSPADEKFAHELGVDMFIKKPSEFFVIKDALQKVKHSEQYLKPRYLKQQPELEVVREYSERLVAKLEEKLSELEKTTQELRHLSKAVEQTADNIVITDKDGMIEYVNPAFEKLTGYTSDEVKGKTPRILKSGKQNDSFYEALWQVILDGRTFRAVFANKKKNGELYYEEQTITPLIDKQGKITHFVSSGRDITDRKRSEEQLAAAHSQLRHLLEHSPAVIYTLAIEGDRITPATVSANIERLLGYRVEEAKKFDWWESSLHQDDRGKTLSGVAETIKQGIFTCEYRVRHKQGHYVWVEDNRRVVRDEDGKPVEIAGVWTDITERKRAEMKLKESENQFRLIAENVADLIVLLDVNGNRIYNSPSYKHILGDPESLKNTLSFNDIHPDDRERIKSIFFDTVKTGVGHRAEFRFIQKDGGIRDVESSGSAIFDENGKVYQILVVSRDVTEQKKIEAQFLRAQRLESIGALAGGIAHDLNNVLSPILMSVDILKKRNKDEETQRFLSILESSALRGSGMIKQVLTFARGVEGERASVQCAHLIREMERIIAETFPKSIQLRVDLPKNLWTIFADATQLHQVFLNLCVNARDAMQNGGVLTISAENVMIDENFAKMQINAKPGRHVVIRFTDTGMGIPANVIDKIFDPFFTTKEVGKGTGLGLSTTHSIVKSHSGFINVYSEVGKGTKFSVYLPAETMTKSEEIETDQIELANGQGELILIVDDEASIRDICRVTLEAYHYRVLTASDGTDAIIQFTKRMNDIRLVITDMVMPFMDGRATIRAINKLNPKVKIIATSGLTAEENSVDRHDLTIFSFLTKPYTAKTLLTTVAEALAK